MSESTFDPSRYLTKVGNQDYLEVKWRLVWLREVHPDASIITECLSDVDQRASFRCEIAIPGGGRAVGHGSESYGDFREYYEKAETKAIGRALGALGFGTQFCEDFNFGSGADSTKFVDSPIDFASTRGRRMADGGQTDTRAGYAGGQGSSTSQPATPRQLKFIQAIAREHNIGDDELNAEVEQLYGRPVAQLDRRDASAYIERLQSRRNVTNLAGH